MKVVILAGGYGTRLSEYTDTIPKPMVPIGGKPILWHIMQRYAFYGHKEFFIALGYKAELIKEYFLKFNAINSDFSVDLSSGKIEVHNKSNKSNLDWVINLVDTGKDSMTGGRVKRLEKLIGKEKFMLTYGDGLADLDMRELEKFHQNHGKMVTVTAVRPSARFGELKLNGNNVKSFKEKPQVTQGWINGGFFICNNKIFDFIKNDKVVLESEPLEDIAHQNQLMAYKHFGFWQCMDTKRDKDFLESLWIKKSAPWYIN